MSKVIDLKNLFKTIEEVKELSDEILHEIDAIDKIEGLKFLSFESIDEDFIYFEGEETWSYGGYEKYRYSFPTNILSSLEEREKFLGKLEAEKLEKQRKAFEAKRKEIAEKEAKEKELLKKLKEKYE